MKKCLLAILLLATTIQAEPVTWVYPPLRCSETFDSCRIIYNHNCDSVGTAKLTDTNAIYFSWTTNDTAANSYDAFIYYPGYASTPVSFSDFMQNPWAADGDTVNWRPMFYWSEAPDTGYITIIKEWTDTAYDTTIGAAYWADTLEVPDSFTVQVTADLSYSGERVSGGILHFDTEHAGTVTGGQGVGSPTSDSYCRMWGTIVDGVDSLEDATIIFKLPDKVKKNTCDSTWIGRREKTTRTNVSGESPHKGYFSIDLPWSSCLGDGQYKVTVKYEKRELIKDELVTVPDSTSYRMW